MHVKLSNNGNEVHADEYELEQDTEERIEEVITEAGEYTLEAELEDGTSETEDQNVSSETGDGYVTITEDEELFISYDTI